MITSGQQLAGYYQPRPSVTQVFDYSTNTAGFIPTVCLSGAADDTVSYQRTIKLKSNHTGTYRLSVPDSFNPITDATPLAYQLYRGNQVGSGVGNSIPLTRPSGRKEPFLGATVMRTTYRGHTARSRSRRSADPQPDAAASRPSARAPASEGGRR